MESIKFNTKGFSGSVEDLIKSKLLTKGLSNSNGKVRCIVAYSFSPEMEGIDVEVKNIKITPKRNFKKA